MNLVILTNNNSSYGKRAIQHFTEAGIEISAIVVIRQPLRYYLTLFGYIKRRVGLIDAILFSLKELMQSDERELKSFRYESYCDNVFFTNGTNSTESETRIRKLQPDILFLAQTGIVRKNIHSLAKIGTLNAHPGVLPDYRGIDCFKWAVLNGDYDKIGASLHWVNSGVDTGNIISSKACEVINTADFKSVEERLYLEGIKLATDFLIQFRDGNVDIGEPQQRESGTQYFKMPLRQERKVKKILLERLAC